MVLNKKDNITINTTSMFSPLEKNYLKNKAKDANIKEQKNNTLSKKPSDIQINNINVDGTINADNINITANNVCNITKKDLPPKPEPSPPKPEPSTPSPSKKPSQNTLIFFIIGGVIVLSIFIISIFLFFKNQKKIVK